MIAYKTPHRIWHHQLLPVGICGSSKKNRRNCRLRRLRVEFLENSLSEVTKFYTLIGDSQPHKPADMKSPSASGRLQNATKYWTKVSKTGAGGIEAHNSVTVWGKITSNNNEFDWTSAEIVKLSGAAFCPAPTNGWASWLRFLAQMTATSIMYGTTIDRSRCDVTILNILHSDTIMRYLRHSSEVVFLSHGSIGDPQVKSRNVLRQLRREWYSLKGCNYLSWICTECKNWNNILSLISCGLLVVVVHRNTLIARATNR